MWDFSIIENALKRSHNVEDLEKYLRVFGRYHEKVKYDGI